MNSVCRDIFKAIHERKWLSVEYYNNGEEESRFWIGIKDLDPVNKKATIEGFHLSKHTFMSTTISISKILSSHVVEGSFFNTPKKLIDDISETPEKFAPLFDSVVNLKILEYLSACNKLDATPYKTEYDLIEELDADRFCAGNLMLNNQQFSHIVNSFQNTAKSEKNNNTRVQNLALNCISINTAKGLYVLAYRNLYLDVKKHSLVAGKHIILNREFIVDKTKSKVESRESINSYLDPADLELLEDVEGNLELIKDKITQYSKEINGVDDMPYIIAIGYDVIVDLDSEYKAIRDMFSKGEPTEPIKAFFGNLTERPRRSKNYPLVLLGKQFNLDQLLAINNAVKYPLTYVQGPPGTGKTQTIQYTILSAFFNKKTVLFSSSNNHPIDEVVKKIGSLPYRDTTIPFPILRIGNKDYMAQAIKDMKKLYKRCQNISVLDTTAEQRASESRNLEAFTELMKRYEELLELKDRKSAIKEVLSSDSTGGNLSFHINMTNKQLPEIESRIEEIGEITDKQALSLLPSNQDELLAILYHDSVKCVKRIDEPKNRELKDIIFSDDEEEAVEAFIKYLSNEKNLKKLMRIFPVIATTCSSARRLGAPKPYFDMTIMDEASQCNTAISLVPILRGKNLMLVGDPQQLNPVIVLDPVDNDYLKRRYGVRDEYDYVSNSIYKSFLACDSVSDEILLHNHYRCNKKIIDFNNRKYYNNKLSILSKSEAANPLCYIDVPNNIAGDKNTAPKEVAEVIHYVESHPETKIGIITPFTNQKALLCQELESRGLNDHVSCGTVHEFQGDEKDVILFSLALTDRTSMKTYGWLKNNKELINVATSRAKDQLVVVYSSDHLERLHVPGEDDLYELVDYVRSNGDARVSTRGAATRALGVKPYSTKTEEAFLTTLNHAMSNVLVSGKKCSVKKEVSISQVFKENYDKFNYLFYMGRFDFVVYEREGKLEYPILAIELDGKEHLDDEIVRNRDQLKEQICKDHGFQLIRVDNSYARRYNYIKDILDTFFTGRNTVVKVKKKKAREQTK